MRSWILCAVLVLLVTACGGDEAGEAPETTLPSTTAVLTTTSTEGETPARDVDAPPWGLDDIEMPDTPEAVAAVFAALPAEVGGLIRTDVSGRVPGAHSVEYTAVDGVVRTLSATPIAEVPAPEGRDLTPLEWLELMTGALEGFEAGSLEPGAPLAWVAAAEQADEDIAYMAAWCVPAGAWYFAVTAESPESRAELIAAFIAAAT